MKSSIFGVEKDLLFMDQAIEQARRAYVQQEVPIGAVVVSSDSQVIGAGHNQVELFHTQRAHAESIAIEQAGERLKDWRLEGCWLYVTLEPCAMCMGLIQLSRLQGIVYGASSPFFGYRLDKEGALSVYNRDLLVTVGGIKEAEVVELLKKFFQQKRNISGKRT